MSQLFQKKRLAGAIAQISDGFDQAARPVRVDNQVKREQEVGRSQWTAPTTYAVSEGDKSAVETALEIVQTIGGPDLAKQTPTILESIRSL